MSRPDEADHAALYLLYETNEVDGLPPSLDGLYPKFLANSHYLGAADGCLCGEPPISYGWWEMEDWSPQLVRTVKWGAPQPPVPTALYRLRDQRRALLYVGITGNLEQRWRTHAADKAWWSEVATRSIEWLPTRSHALAAEAEAIRSERPRYNRQHNRLSD
jgi:predicted GIY-YIG superfamily endonuclease